MTLRALLRKPGDVVEIVRLPAHAPTPEGYARARVGGNTHHDRWQPDIGYRRIAGVAAPACMLGIVDHDEGGGP